MKSRNLESQKDLYGHSSSPKNEDVYDNDEIEEDIDPENIFKSKENRNKGKFYANNEKVFEEDETGDDLDIPGAELDDEEEEIGSEDEENNYYSLGGDNHDNLEEDSGD